MADEEVKQKFLMTLQTEKKKRFFGCRNNNKKFSFML